MKYKLGYDYLFTCIPALPYKDKWIGDVSIGVSFKAYDNNNKLILPKEYKEVVFRNTQDEYSKYGINFSYYLSDTISVCYDKKKGFKIKYNYKIINLLQLIGISKIEYCIEYFSLGLDSNKEIYCTEPLLISEKELVDLILNNPNSFNTVDNKNAQVIACFEVDIDDLNEGNILVVCPSGTGKR